MSGATARALAKEEDHPSYHDPWTAFLYHPRTFTALLCAIAFLVYSSGTFQDQVPAASVLDANLIANANSKAGTWACIAGFLIYSICLAPDPVLIRPHPAFWRMVHGVAVIYVLFLVFLLFMAPGDARQFMVHLHPDLGVKLPERSYGADCRIYIPGDPNPWKNLKDTIFDEFVIAHALGWFCKALAFRHTILLWAISVTYEIMELTFEHMLPNFNECWWDSWILDVLICNAMGIYFGMKCVRYFNAKEYSWSGISKTAGYTNKMKRAALQLTPHSWDDYWNDAGPKRFIQTLVILVAALTMEINAFFLKYVLWVPPRNPLNTYRLAVWFFISIPAMKEYNMFLNGKERHIGKMGVFSWLTIAALSTEILICIKFGKGQFPNPAPFHVVAFWGCVLGGLGAGLHYWNHSRTRAAAASASKEA